MHFLELALLALATSTAAFPSHRSLAGLSNQEIERIIPTLSVQDAEPAPGPPNDTSAKLVNDAAHPWKPLRDGDIRGPCPGLNTLASHGVGGNSSFLLSSGLNTLQWLDRSGITTPGNIVKAVQDGG
jgi:hypothetical protein